MPNTNMRNFSDQVLAELQKYAAPGDAEHLGRFFKTGEGQYGAGDVFIGVRVPDVRRVTKKFGAATLPQIADLLASPIHEMRACACMILADRATKANDKTRKELLDFYLQNTARINNWDLVDSSCRDVVGAYILKHPEAENLLPKLAKSQDLWERRIAMVSTWPLIRAGKLDMAYQIAEQLLADKHDLIQKAVGWMLREAGDKNADRLRTFLTANIAHIPRTSLRYAIEHFDADERQYFLKLK